MSIDLYNDLPQPPQSGRLRRVLVIILLAAVVLAGGASMVLARFGRPLSPTPLIIVSQNTSDSQATLTYRARRARALIDHYQPRGLYIVVDTFRNRLRVMRGTEVLRSAICSTGTGVELRDPRNGHVWVFDTPLGERVVERKTRNPVWAKPDWAFIEEGYLPPKDPSERFDSYSLGDYGLYMGDGYIIHGTLFPSLLGRRVTHGCIRLGDKDLEYVYHNAPLGTRVYLY